MSQDILQRKERYNCGKKNRCGEIKRDTALNPSRRILRIVILVVASHIVRRSNRPSIHPYQSTATHFPPGVRKCTLTLATSFPNCARAHADDVTRRTIGRAGVHVTARLASVWRVAEGQKETRATRRVGRSRGATKSERQR